jgi:hypothetical protein
MPPSKTLVEDMEELLNDTGTMGSMIDNKIAEAVASGVPRYVLETNSVKLAIVFIAGREYERQLKSEKTGEHEK